MSYQKAIVLTGLVFSLSLTGMGVIGFPEEVVAQAVVAGKAKANQLLQQGIEQFDNYRREEALQSWQRALAIYHAIQDQQGEAGTLMNIGFLYQSDGEFEKAITYYERALPIFQQIKDLKRQADTLMNMGSTYLYQSQYLDAQLRKVPSQAQPASQRSGFWLSPAHKMLAEKAVIYYERALPIFQQIEDLKGQADTLSSLATVCILLEQEKGIRYMEQAAQVCKQIKDPLNQCK